LVAAYFFGPPCILPRDGHVKRHEPKSDTTRDKASVYQVSPPVGSCYNVIYVISWSKVIPDCDTKVTTTSDIGQMDFIYGTLYSLISLAQ